MPSISKYLNLISLRAFDPNLHNVVKACNLLPCKSWRLWRDENGNILKILNSKQISVRVKPGIGGTYDLYFKLHPLKILQQGQWVLSTLQPDHECLLFVLGKDEKLRLLRWKDGWQENLPVLVGNKLLNIVNSNFKKTNKGLNWWSDFLPIENIEEKILNETLKGE